MNDPAKIAHLLRALATGSDHIASKNSVIFVAAAELLEAQAADTRRIDWLETAAKASQTGISFDRVTACGTDRAGWRFMRRHFVGDPERDIRYAIDKAQLLESTFRR